MHIGMMEVQTKLRTRSVGQLSNSEYAEAIQAMRRGELWNPLWDNTHAGQTLKFPASHGQGQATNADIPDDLFNFDLILNGNQFRVLIEDLIRIKHREDLAQFSDQQLVSILEKVASYSVTCYCAYAAAHRELQRWQMWHNEWMAAKREEARQQIRVERLADRNAGLRKEIGQITAQETEDWVMLKFPVEYRENIMNIAKWEENEKLYLELRDTMNSRGMHLQSMLRMVGDNTRRTMSSGN